MDNTRKNQVKILRDQCRLYLAVYKNWKQEHFYEQAVKCLERAREIQREYQTNITLEIDMNEYLD